MSKEKLIKKIVINVGGLKGLTLSGTVESIKENKIAINTFVDGVKHPIHRELEAGIEELRFAILEICGLFQETTKKDVRTSLMSGCDILNIEFERGDTPWFKIKANSRVLSDKFQTLTTPKIDSEDGYEHFDTVMKIIDKVLEEVGHYVNKTKVVSDEDLIESLIRHGKGKSIDREALEVMSLDEKRDYLEGELSKLGFITNTIHVSEMAGEEEEEGEEIDLDEKPESNELIFDENGVHEESGDLPDLSDVEELKVAEPVMLKK